MSRSFISVCGRDIKVQGRLLRIASLDGEKFTFPDDPEAMIAALRKQGSRVDLLTFLGSPLKVDRRYTYPTELDNLAIIPITTFDHWFTKQVDSKLRNMSRKAQKKGVELCEIPFGDELVRGICEIYNETPIRQGRRFPHYGMTPERARDYAGTFLNRSIFIGAFFKGRIVGFVKMVTDDTRRYACIVHILAMLQHRDKAPTNALIAQAVRSCADRGITQLAYDHFAYGKKQRDSLSDFKVSNGFQRVDIARYYVPLTRFGHVGLRMGLHHRLVERFPEPIMAKLRDLRSSWYMRRLSSSAGTS